MLSVATAFSYDGTEYFFLRLLYVYVYIHVHVHDIIGMHTVILCHNANISLHTCACVHKLSCTLAKRQSGPFCCKGLGRTLSINSAKVIGFTTYYVPKHWFVAQPSVRMCRRVTVLVLCVCVSTSLPRPLTVLMQRHFARFLEDRAFSGSFKV